MLARRSRSSRADRARGRRQPCNTVRPQRTVAARLRPCKRATRGSRDRAALGGCRPRAVDGGIRLHARDAEDAARAREGRSRGGRTPARAPGYAARLAPRLVRVRGHDALVERALARFEQLGLDWYAAETRALL